uniref:EF-hand domain-containing protein n=1 Tax=Taeniopygia guttata TaxID=59729 RepID=A0A674GWZ9_TAEGU
MKTDLELALECAVNIYHRYAVQRPVDDYLSKNEFSKLLKETAEPFLTDSYIQQLFTKADANHDGRLKFTEFLTTLSLVAIDAHNRSHKGPGDDHGHGHGHDHSHGHGHDHGHDHGHGHGPGHRH